MSKNFAPVALGTALLASAFSGAANAKPALPYTEDGVYVTRNICQLSDNAGDLITITRGKTLVRVFGMEMKVKGDQVSFTDKDLREAMPFTKAESAPLVESARAVRQACREKGFRAGLFGLFK